MISRTLLRAGSITALGYGITALVGVAAIRLFTQLASPAVFGTANLIVTTLTLVSGFLVAPVANTQIRYHSAALEWGEEESFTRAALLWSIAGTVLSIIISLIFYAAYLIFGGKPANQADVMLAIGLLSLKSVRDTLLNRLQAERKQARYIGLVVAESVLLSGTTALFLWFVSKTTSYLAGQLLGSSILVFVAILISSKSIWRRRECSNSGSKYPFYALLRQYGLAFVPIGIFNWLSNLSDRYTLALILGSGAVGLYAAPFAIGSRIIMLVNGMLSDVFRPILFQAVNEGSDKKAQEVFWWWLFMRVVASIFSLAFLLVFGGFVVNALLSPPYRHQALGVILWVSLGYSVFGLANVFDARTMSLDASTRTIIPLIVGGVANVILSFVLVPLNGIIGAAQSSCGSYLAQSIASGFALNMVLRRRKSSASVI